MDELPVVQQLASLADGTRVRLLLVLERHELTVSELCAVVQLPQSTVSRHLRTLSDQGWLAWRSEGTSRPYRLTTPLDAAARGLWEVVRRSAAETPEARQDGERARAVLERRRSRSQAFFMTEAGRWEGLRAELFGEQPELPALLALLDPEWVVGDLGCGTGALAVMLARYVKRVVAVDESPAMLEAARRRATEAAVGEVDLREGRLEALPLPDSSLDVALLVLVLHYVARPELVLAEASRVLRPGGRALVLDMLPHGRSEYRERMGHLWQGFEPDEVGAWLGSAGFGDVRHHTLPASPAGKGPLLFVAVGMKARDSGDQRSGPGAGPWPKERA